MGSGERARGGIRGGASTLCPGVRGGFGWIPGGVIAVRVEAAGLSVLNNLLAGGFDDGEQFLLLLIGDLEFVQRGF
jgi:hypothetical protein